MKLKRFLVIALSMMMVLGMSVNVFAAGQNSSNEHPSYAATEAKLVKYLQVADGVTGADNTFTFSFTSIDSTNSTIGVPASVHTSFTTDITPSETVTGGKKGVKTIAEIFTGYQFSRAGEYAFTVKEKTPASPTSGMVYSSETYTLKLIVDNDGNIDDVTVENKDGNKVTPTDDDPTDNPGGATPAGSNGGFTFTNKYTKNSTTHTEPQDPNPDPDPTNPEEPTPIDETKTQQAEGAFVLDKFVLGEYGDRTKGFDFVVTVTLPSTDAAFDLTASGHVPTGGVIDPAKTWAEGKKVTLKHGEQLKFPELPVGTKITVTETSYTAAGYATVWTTSLNPDSTTDITIGDNGGYAICRNSFKDNTVTPTGIVINNLPYILLIAIALGGIVLFARKRRYDR